MQTNPLRNNLWRCTFSLHHDYAFCAGLFPYPFLIMKLTPIAPTMFREGAFVFLLLLLLCRSESQGHIHLEQQ
jgi:hypothetical protein